MSLDLLPTDPYGMKVNVDRDYPALLSATVIESHVGFIPALKDEAFTSNFP